MCIYIQLSLIEFLFPGQGKYSNFVTTASTVEKAALLATMHQLCLSLFGKESGDKNTLCI
jgi:hypothetical protein